MCVRACVCAFLSLFWFFYVRILLIFLFSCWKEMRRVLEEGEREKKVMMKDTKGSNTISTQLCRTGKIGMKERMIERKMKKKYKKRKKKHIENDKTANKWRRRNIESEQGKKRYFEYFSACNLAENMSSIQCVNVNVQEHFLLVLLSSLLLMLLLLSIWLMWPPLRCATFFNAQLNTFYLVFQSLFT